MRKLSAFLIQLIVITSSSYSQCTSSATTYDLTVSGNTVLGPSGPSYTFAIVCGGGRLMDSATCCTRLVHVEGGGIYEAGPAAYAFVYLKSGATFDAHGNNSFFGVSYEAGATILNYTGPMTLCTTVTFPPGSCIPTEMADHEEMQSRIFPNPANNVLYFENSFLKNTGIEVYDLSGKKIMEATEIGNELDVSGLEEGMYTFAMIREGKKVSCGRFAVIR